MVLSTPPCSEAELVAALHTRNQAGFTALHGHYAPSLLRILQRIVGDSDAADLLQDVFIKVWQQGHRYDPAQGKLFTWLITLVRRTAFDYIRARRRVGFEDLSVALNNPDWSHTPVYWHLDVNHRMAAVLTQSQGQIIHLVYWQGYTQQAIAEELRLPVGTVKTRLRAALQQLRRVLADPQKNKAPSTAVTSTSTGFVDRPLPAHLASAYSPPG